MSSTPRILVVGDLMLDVEIRGHASRLAQEAPVPVVLNPTRKTFAGGAANAAVNAAAMGAKVTLIGMWDGCGELYQICTDFGIEMLNISNPSAVNTVKTRIYADNHLICRYDSESPNPVSSATKNLIVNQVFQFSKEFDSVLLSDYGKSMRHVLTELRMPSRTCPCPDAILDPCLSTPDSYGELRYKAITPNWSEACALIKESTPRDPASDLEASYVAEKIFWRSGNDSVGSVFVKRGQYGCTVIPSGKPFGVFHIRPPHVQSVFDVQGAGDSFVAALSVFWSLGPVEAARHAVAAGTIAVSKPGTAVVTRQEVLDAVNSVNVVSRGSWALDDNPGDNPLLR